MKEALTNNTLGILRILMGWTFLWPFFDKLLGLGFSTTPDKSWLAGASPTTGFLSFASKGPFAPLYQAMAGMVWVDWLFMIGLLLIGLALILGIGVKIAAMSGSLLLLMMWTAVLPPEHNPIIDEHIVYIFVLMVLKMEHAGNYLGFGKIWSESALVKQYPILR